MRRKDKEITDKEVIENLLNESKSCRLALANNNEPYIVPINFAYKDNCIYLHSASIGKKIEILKINKKVCFQVDSAVEVVEAELACNWSAKYLSVIGYGNAEIITNREDKIVGLDIIMEKYSGRCNHKYSEKALDNIVIVKITIDSITGKKSGF